MLKNSSELVSSHRSVDTNAERIVAGHEYRGGISAVADALEYMFWNKVNG